ncbi:ribonuclease III domain-containing protein [Aspergillus keveii]|uniref:Ribonuclease III domain-containing protein n=1 Tax=Aspergillus keveii TaxID=714993 RepID=A0ABR4FKQ9_9EURO
MSAKVLADVVEALIGAAYLDGGLGRARACAQQLLPEVRLRQMPLQPYSEAVPQDDSWATLQTYLGYSFENPPLLVEALTHPSCAGKSYQRLEFLGDAILDMIVISKLAHHPTEMAQGEMSMIKHAASNHHILAFFCLDLGVCDKTGAYAEPLDNKAVEAVIEPGLWRFMRFNGPSLSPEPSQQAVLARYLVLRDQIIFCLQKAKEYPWQALIKLNADKYFSDLIESVLGAIYVDSSGDLAACESFLEKIGLLRFLDRILRDRVDIAHPKNIVQKLSRSLAKFDVKRTLPAEGSDTIYECRVSIGDVIIAVAESCLCHEETEVEAAAVAIRRLQETPVDTLVGSNPCSG